MALLDLVGRRWALRALWELRDGPRSFRALQERCGRVSSSVLAARLAELRDTHIVALVDDGYHLTALGRELLGLLLPLGEWAERWAEHLEGEPDPAGR